MSQDLPEEVQEETEEQEETEVQEETAVQEEPVVQEETAVQEEPVVQEETESKGPDDIAKKVIKSGFRLTEGILKNALKVVKIPLKTIDKKE